jgi:hypothetical protein
MTWKDKLELGLKNDAAFRKDNLPPSQVRGPEVDSGPGRSPEIPLAREDETQVVKPPDARRSKGKARKAARARSGPARRKR